MIEKIIKIVKSEGKNIMTVRLDTEDISVKSSRRDFVTAYDLSVQESLIGKLDEILPGTGFLCEESDFCRKSNNGFYFIIDPIDGTANFIRGINYNCISVALKFYESIILGIVYNPHTDELFMAEKGKGAYLNGENIMTSNLSLCDGLVIFGTSIYNDTVTHDTFSLAEILYKSCLDIRRFGSAALDICMVACGKAELFYELSLSVWDYAAASLILNEAGGRITTINGNDLNFSHGSSVLAGGVVAYNDFQKINPFTK
ncbi:MAG: inositol monophosphatase family protein [Syntrophomonadaceae bacterium]|jgi:myo-inositol-1(or 4)-monophosphatase